MNATSTQTFKDIIAIDFELQTFPDPDTQDKFIVSATNRDDIFCFVFEGPDIIRSCKKTGLFTGWEKDQKIKELEEKVRELEKDNKNLTEAYNSMHEFVGRALKEKLQLKEEYEEKIEDLQHKYDLERGANEAQRKFLREYAGEGTEIEFNYAIGDGDEVSYVIVDKEEYKALKNIQNNVKYNSYYGIHGKVYNPAQIADRVLELEEALKFLRNKYKALKELKSPTVENFADKEPTSRRDILKAAEMCVCGQREQDYGTPESNFQLIADLWNDYLKKEKSSIVVDSMDVAMMMALLKIARIRNGGGSGDSFVDLAGYAACGGEIWYGGKTQVPEGE